jgi:hypothetical protein
LARIITYNLAETWAEARHDGVLCMEAFFVQSSQGTVSLGNMALARQMRGYTVQRLCLWLRRKCDTVDAGERAKSRRVILKHNLKRAKAKKGHALGQIG